MKNWGFSTVSHVCSDQLPGKQRLGWLWVYLQVYHLRSWAVAWRVLVKAQNLCLTQNHHCHVLKACEGCQSLCTNLLQHGIPVKSHDASQSEAHFSYASNTEHLNIKWLNYNIIRLISAYPHCPGRHIFKRNREEITRALKTCLISRSVQSMLSFAAPAPPCIIPSSALAYLTTS